MTAIFNHFQRRRKIVAGGGFIYRKIVVAWAEFKQQQAKPVGVLPSLSTLGARKGRFEPQFDRTDGHCRKSQQTQHGRTNALGFGI